MEVTEWRDECGFGDASMGMTAGRGIEGAGDRDRRDESEERRLWLWLMTLGGFMGSAIEVGVPGADGTGEPVLVAFAPSTDSWDLKPNSGGAGLLDEMRRGGRSVLEWLAILLGSSSKAIGTRISRMSTYVVQPVPFLLLQDYK